MEPLALTGLEDGEELAFTRAVMRHLHEDDQDEAALAPWARELPTDRALVVRDGDTIAANLLAVPTDISVPGGALLPCAAVTGVGVAQTHRRRGSLRRLMTAALDRAVDEGEAVAALYATESAIYPRFGFGPSVGTRTSRPELREVRFSDPVDDHLVRAASPAEAIATAVEVYAALRAQRPGGVGRDAGLWRLHLEDDPPAWRDGATSRRLVHVPGRGYATYRVKDHWDAHDLPAAEVRVGELVASDPEAEQALWQHVLSIDLARTATVTHRPVDDALPWTVVDPLRLRTRIASAMYTRLLDVARCLASRTAPVAGTAVLEVIDADRDQSGTYRWEVGPDGASCERVNADPEVTCTVADLAAVWLGGVSPRDLQAARRLDEHVGGAVDRLAALTATVRAPWTPWEF